MLDNDFILSDRIQKIKSINEMYDLENNAYVSFSGGKDSTVLHYLIDIALPNNRIPRVFLNTGIEYNYIVDFVRKLSKNDERITIISPKSNIRDVLTDYGYPFKSKEHSQKVALYQHSGMTKTVSNYLGNGNKKTFLCPEKLKYQFSEDFTLKVSDKCCFKMKKEVAKVFANENSRAIAITGVRQGEGGLRKSMQGCTTFTSDKLDKFHPLFPLEDDWIDLFIKENKIELCELYYPPFNFKRTGCKGCPFSLELEKQLDTMKFLLPQEYKQCNLIWKPVYDEYRRIGYRLKDNQDLFSF